MRIQVATPCLSIAPALVIAALLAPASAGASGLQLPALGSTRAGVTTPGPSSVHDNPAGLGFGRAMRLMVGGNLILGSLGYTREYRATYQQPDSLDYALPIDPAAIDPDKRGPQPQVTATPFGVVPAIALELPLEGQPLALGFGLDVPYAALVRWPGDGPQRFQLDDATLATVFVNAAIAYRATERLSVGAGLSYVLGYADLSRTQDLATVQDLADALARPPISQTSGFGPDADPALRELDTFARRFDFNNGWAHGITFRVGVTFRAQDRLWLAASYEHSTHLDANGGFELNMDDPFFTQDLVSQGLRYPRIVRGDASLSFTLPRVLRAGVRYGFGPARGDGEPDSSVALEGTYTGWSSVRRFDVRIKAEALAQPELRLGPTLQLQLPRDWHDTFGAVLRGSHRLSDDWALWAGLGAESAAVPDRTLDAASPDGFRITAFGGVALRVAQGTRVLLDLTYQQVLSRDVKGSDYDLANGSYRMFLLMAGAYIDHTF